jgi:hypothetical protein
MSHARSDGFFITAFTDRSQFVHHSLKEQALKLGATLETLGGCETEDAPLSVNQLDLHDTLSRKLKESAFVVVDLTPADLGTGAFNPNVMFELGRALEWNRPIYSICDNRVLDQKRHGAIPFDIASLKTNTYEFSPEGLKRLATSFASWLDHGRFRRHSLAHKHILDLVELRDQFSSWDESTLHRFGPVINVVMGRLKEYADRIARANRNKTGKVAFEPLRRQDMIEEVFCSTLSVMVDGDAYDTVSTLEFWREIEGGTEAGTRNSIDSLLAATKSALDRGVVNRRLFLIQNRSAAAAAPAALIQGHENLRARYSDIYTLGYYLASGPEEYTDLRNRYHVGVCRVRSQDEAFVLRPSYSLRNDGSERLIALNYDLGKDAADRCAVGIDALWKSGSPTGRLFSRWDDVSKALAIAIAA